MTAPGQAGPRPSRLGRYELITQIGQGGMAEVQLALQHGPAGFEKLVVVKLVHENLATQKAFVDMLLDEARMAALVKHPNVVDIYDLGQADGRYFIAMEYLEGEPLLAVLRAGREGRRLDPLSTGRLIADTAEGLDAAHELRTMAGEPIELVHHDVSLGNIVVLYNGQVKLVDFGVAKATQSAGPRAKVQGKFSYMAPEKLRGGPGDRRSDIWSLGCVLWEALTLRRLFKGGNDSETMRQVLETRIALPSAINGEVPQDFDPIVMRALERDPARRYSTAKEMASDLEEVLRQHKYGGKNDAIARYMQATFEAHINARKKLLQEVSSKGRASDEILEAAFTELASGSPAQAPHEFSVKFRLPSGQLTVPEHGGRARTDSSSPPRIARPSESFLTQPYEPETAAQGGGTAAARRTRTPRLQLGIGGGLVVLIVILAVALGGGGGDEPASPDRDRAVGSNVAAAGASADATDPGGGSADAAGPDVEVIEVGDGADSGSGVAEVASSGAGSSEGSRAGSVSTRPDRAAPRPPRPNANELFKTGMQAYVKGDHKTSVGLFRKAVQARPGYATAWRALGLAHEKLGQWGQAKTALQRYLQLAPNAADAVPIRERLGNL